MNIWHLIAFLIFVLAILIGFEFDKHLKAQYLEKLTLRISREKILGRKNRRVQATIDRHNKLLSITGIPLFGFFVLAGASVLLGFFIGKLMFSDFILSCATALGFITIPSIYLEVQAGKYQVYEAEKLENALSLITNSFLSSCDIVSAVKENLHLIELKKPFEEFYTEVTLVDANIERALHRLAAKHPSPFLSQWVDAVIMSQHDRKMMFILPTIINQMNDVRQDQLEANTAMAKIWREYISLLLLICAIPVVFRFVLYEWYAILTTTVIGRCFMLALIAAILYSLRKAVKINQPIVV